MTDNAARPLAVVTGASSGIGLELARVLAAHDHDLVVCAEDAAIHEVAASLPGTARAVQVDLATWEGNEELLARTDLDTRPVAVAVINAGVGAAGRFVDTDLEDDLRLVQLNVGSTVHLGKAFARQMAAGGQGRLLFTSSVASQMPGPGYATYAASKSFVQSFAHAIRVELADSGVSVTSLLPGPTDTDFFARAGMRGTRVDEGHKDDPRKVAEDAYEALMAGKAEVVAGSLLNSVQTVAAQVLPDAVKARLHGMLTRRSS